MEKSCKFCGAQYIDNADNSFVYVCGTTSVGESFSQGAICKRMCNHKNPEENPEENPELIIQRLKLDIVKLKDAGNRMRDNLGCGCHPFSMCINCSDSIDQWTAVKSECFKS